MLGHFANSDGWYGRGDFTEYVRLLADAEGRLVALMVLGYR